MDNLEMAAYKARLCTRGGHQRNPWSTGTTPHTGQMKNLPQTPENNYATLAPLYTQIKIKIVYINLKRHTGMAYCKGLCEFRQTRSYSSSHQFQTREDRVQHRCFPCSQKDDWPQWLICLKVRSMSRKNTEIRQGRLWLLNYRPYDGNSHQDYNKSLRHNHV